MLYKNIFNMLEDNPQFKEFINNIEDFELMIKELNQEEIKRLSLEYPELLKSKPTNKGTKEHAVSNSIFCLTFIINSLKAKNYFKLKKLKIYFDNSKERIIKILKN